MLIGHKVDVTGSDRWSTMTFHFVVHRLRNYRPVNTKNVELSVDRGLKESCFVPRKKGLKYKNNPFILVQTAVLFLVHNVYAITSSTYTPYSTTWLLPYLPMDKLLRGNCLFVHAITFLEQPCPWRKEVKDQVVNTRCVSHGDHHVHTPKDRFP